MRRPRVADKAAVLTYREGEPLRELSKYLGAAAASARAAARRDAEGVSSPHASATLTPPAPADGAAEGAPLEVRIPADAVTAANRQARAPHSACALRPRVSEP